MIGSLLRRVLRKMSNRTVAFSFVSFYLLITLININTVFKSEVPKIGQSPVLIREMFDVKAKPSQNEPSRSTREVTVPIAVEVKKAVEFANVTGSTIASKVEEAKVDRRRNRLLKNKLLRDKLKKQKKLVCCTDLNILRPSKESKKNG